MTEQTDDELEYEPEEDFEDFYVNPVVTLILVYKDGAGAASTRKVTVTYVSRDGERVMIEGYCHLRKEDRTFRLDRIQRAETTGGKVMTGDDLFAYLAVRRSEEPADFEPPAVRSRQRSTKGKGAKSGTSFKEIMEGIAGIGLIAGMIFGYVKDGWAGVIAAMIIIGFIIHFVGRAFK